jgi:hypothetical protein
MIFNFVGGQLLSDLVDLKFHETQINPGTPGNQVL